MKTLPRMLAFLALTNVGILAVTHLMGPQRSGWALFGCWLLNLGVVGVAAAIVGKAPFEAPGSFVVLILLALFACIYGVVGGRAPKVFSLRESPLLAIADVGTDPQKFDVWRFSGGRINLDLVAHREMWMRNHRLHYYAAPVLPADWKKGDPIPAWVVHSSGSFGVPESWKKECSGGYDEEYRKLVEDTSRSRSLNTRANAPILTCSDDPRNDFLGTAWFELGALLLIDLVGVVSAL